MRIGFAKVDITPPLPSEQDRDLYLLGFWHERAKPYDRIADPLHARAVVFSDGKDLACLVAVDLIGDALGLGDDARVRIERSLGIPPERVMIACTHAHTTPETIGLTQPPISKRWRQSTVARIEQAVAQALHSLQEQQMFLLERRIPGLTVNRRAQRVSGHPEWAQLGHDAKSRAAAVDETLRLLRTGEKDNPAGIVANFGCHPVAVQTQPFISADFPGVLTRELEQHAETALFTNSATGDLNPFRKEGWKDAEFTGKALAQEALVCLQHDHGVERETSPIRCAVEQLELPRRDLPPLEGLLDQKRELENQLAAEPDSPVDAPGHPGARLFRLNEVIALHSFPERLTAEIQALRIGSWIVVGIPGELFCCLGDDIRAAARNGKTWVIGYANGYLGYIAPLDAHRLGGYEVSVARWSPLAPGAGETVRDRAVQLVRRLEASGL